MSYVVTTVSYLVAFASGGAVVAGVWLLHQRRHVCHPTLSPKARAAVAAARAEGVPVGVVEDFPDLPHLDALRDFAGHLRWRGAQEALEESQWIPPEAIEAGQR